jgi:hypothetical protein
MTYTFKLARRLASNHRVALAAVAVLTTACGGSSPTGPDPVAPPVTSTAGWLTVQLTTPNTDDGAVQFSITGPGVDSVRVLPPYSGYGTVPASGAGHVVATGAIATGAVARVWVRDVARANQVTASVSAAAQRGTYALSSLSGYRATVVR